MRKPILLGVIASGLVMAAQPALADSVQGTRFDVHEKSHVVELKIDRGTATLVVTRTVENAGPKSDQAMFWLDMPDGAVATRLRTAATNAQGETTWFEGELMEAEAAAKKYQELTGIGGYYPKDPALLSWRSQKKLLLQVFPVPARSSKTIEYTLRMPVTYEAGAYKLALPKLGTEALPAKIKVVAAHAEDPIDVNGVRIVPGSFVTASQNFEVKMTPRSAPAIDGALASFGFAKDRHLVHARIAAAPHLSSAPQNAAVVVLIDTSRSMDRVGTLESAMTAARAYLSALPNASVEVMTFDRVVRSPFGGPLPTKEALAKLYGFSPPTANGSQLDDALARADAKLAQAPTPTRRILLITDLHPREALTPERFASKNLTSGALLHMATVGGGSPQVTRDDDSPWATVPRRTGGLLWTASCGSNVDGAAREVFEEWVRPKRIEKLAVKGLPDFDAPQELVEGGGLDHFVVAKNAVSSVTVEGELWSKPLRWTMSPSNEEAKTWSALVFGSDLLGSLSEPEQMTLAMNGRAVSPVTSYLAIEPGVRPSTEGLDEAEGALGHGGVGGIGQGFGSGHGRLGGHRSGVDRAGFLKKSLANAMAACSVHGRATATIESTFAEIVDVRQVAVAPVKDTKAEACITEQLWGVTLPAAFEDDHDDWDVVADRE